MTKNNLTWTQRLVINGAVRYISRREPVKSYKTTIIGIVGAIANAAYPLITQGIVPPETIIVSVVIAVLGYFAKDYNISGTGGK